MTARLFPFVLIAVKAMGVLNPGKKTHLHRGQYWITLPTSPPAVHLPLMSRPVPVWSPGVQWMTLASSFLMLLMVMIDNILKIQHGTITPQRPSACFPEISPYQTATLVSWSSIQLSYATGSSLVVVVVPAFKIMCLTIQSIRTYRQMQTRGEWRWGRTRWKSTTYWCVFLEYYSV